jgi:hypothetical protein
MPSSAHRAPLRRGACEATARHMNLCKAADDANVTPAAIGHQIAPSWNVRRLIRSGPARRRKGPPAQPRRHAWPQLINLAWFWLASPIERNKPGRCGESGCPVWRLMAYGFTSQVPDPSSMWRSVTGLNSYPLSGRNIVPGRETGEIHASPIADSRRCRCRHDNLVGQHRLRPNANPHASPRGCTPCIHLRAGAHPVLRLLL